MATARLSAAQLAPSISLAQRAACARPSRFVKHAHASCCCTIAARAAIAVRGAEAAGSACAGGQAADCRLPAWPYALLLYSMCREVSVCSAYSSLYTLCRASTPHMPPLTCHRSRHGRRRLVASTQPFEASSCGAPGDARSRRRACSAPHARAAAPAHLPALAAHAAPPSARLSRGLGRLPASAASPSPACSKGRLRPPSGCVLQGRSACSACLLCAHGSLCLLPGALVRVC